MFSLIISILAVVLVIVLAGAALYYGGDAYNEGVIKGQVAQYKNEAAQIAGALVAYRVDQTGFTDHPDDGDGSFDWNDLVVGEYLSTLPSSAEGGNPSSVRWGVKDNLIILPGVSDEVCVASNRLDGFPTDEAGVLAMQGSTAAHQIGDEYVPECTDSLDPAIPCCYDANPST